MKLVLRENYSLLYCQSENGQLQLPLCLVTTGCLTEIIRYLLFEIQQVFPRAVIKKTENREGNMVTISWSVL